MHALLGRSHGHRPDHLHFKRSTGRRKRAEPRKKFNPIDEKRRECVERIWNSERHSQLKCFPKQALTKKTIFQHFVPALRPLSRASVDFDIGTISFVAVNVAHPSERKTTLHFAAEHSFNENFILFFSSNFSVAFNISFSASCYSHKQPQNI